MQALLHSYPGLSAFLILLSGRVAMAALWALVPTRPGVTVLAAMIALDVAVLLWQLAVIRTVLRRRGASLDTAMLSLCAIIAVAMVAITGLNRLSAAALRPAPVISSALDMPISDGSISLTGTIAFGHYEGLKRALAEDDPKFDSVVLSSDGGRIPAARGLARLVREAGLNTHVDGTCASACTLIFIAGTRRTIGPEARIGFHGYKLLSNITTVTVREEEEKDRAAFQQKGVADQFLDRAFATPHHDIWFPPHDQLRAAGVVTE